MSAINLFDSLIHRQPKAEAIGVEVPGASESRANWLDEPVSTGQKIAIHKFFRRKNLLAETDQEWLAIFAKLAVFDSETGYWLPPAGFTKGEAKELQERLFALPWQSGTPASKVTTGQAKPMPKASTVSDDQIAARVAAAEAAAKAEPEDLRQFRKELAEGNLKQMVASAVAEALAGLMGGTEPEAPKPQANLVPEGYEVRVGKKGPYLAKRR